jgi:excisionase family DNA binding protein
MTKTRELPQRDYLTAEEVARLIRVPVSTLYAWRYRKSGPPARRVGRKLLYERSEVIRWVESQLDDGAA